MPSKFFSLKNKLIFIFGIISALFLTFFISCNSSEITDTPEQIELINPYSVFARFTFDYGVKGVAPVEMSLSELSGGTLTEEADPVNPQNQCVLLNKISIVPSEQLSVYKDFTPVTQGNVSVEAKLMIADVSNQYQFTLWTDASTEIAGVSIVGGKMTAVDNSGSSMVLVSQVQMNRWFTVKMVLDLSEKVYDIYVDGKKKSDKPLAWMNQKTAQGQFGRMLFRNCGSTTPGIFYVDDIIIRASHIPGLVYNSGTDKLTSTSVRLTGRTCPTLYYLSLPVGWTPTKRWPVFMYNIREGWDGAAPSDGPQIFAQKRGNMPFIIVSVKTKNIQGSDNGYPKEVLNYCNATSDQLFDEIAVIELFQQIREDYNGEDKFYWDGFSASGHSFWPLVMWRPEFIAAACVSAGNYLGNGGPNPADLGRGMTSKGVSNAPERINLPVKQYTGALDAVADIGVSTGKGMWQQFMNAKATCEAHGYTNVSLDILPNVGHAIHFDAELAYFYAHWLSTHPDR